MVVGGDEEEGVAMDKGEGTEAGTRRRAWRRGRWRRRGGGCGDFVVDEEEVSLTGSRRSSLVRRRA